MLLNLSNHPYEKWAPAQQQAADAEFVTVTDMPFPDIDPFAGTEQINTLAEETARKITELLKNTADSNENHAVHIMGEFTFCYALITKLKQAGIRCIASTTRRIVEMNGNEKISRFEFCRFRDY